MNCTVHPDVAATSYCRTCGKPMCEKCSHSVRGVVYCEDCIATRLHDTMPAAPASGFVPGTQVAPVVVTSGPSPGLAGVLAGFFPFGVGAVYNGQYAKGLAHMLIFVALIFGVSQADANGGALGPVFGLGIAFFYIYQIIDAVRSAHAIRAGQPAPDPFGLAKAFGSGERVDFNRIPVGALVLIGLGVLFLLNTMGLFHTYWIHRLWPLILIAIGVWLFVKRFTPPGGVSREM
ncbi:MAG: B-box zinc finger protein [Acidobacteriia bacterium]|nr:B-box zinc finger protein [Terriglobia bacterium]